MAEPKSGQAQLARPETRVTGAFRQHLTNSAHNLTSVYVVALSLIAILSLSGFFVLQTVVKTGKRGATLINISGRQRRLSQQVALFTLDAATATNPQDYQAARKRLTEVLDVLDKTHAVLSQGKAELDLPAGITPKVRDLYFGKETNLDQQIREYVKHARAVLACPQPVLNRDNADVKYVLKAGPNELLASLTMLVKQHELDSQAELEQIDTIERCLLALTMLLLAAEALFIFFPMSTRIKKQMNELLDSQRELNAVFDTVGEALLTMDADNSVITANNQVEAIWGADRSAVVGKKLDDFVMLDDQATSLTKGDHLGRRLEVDGLRPNGNKFPLEITITRTNLSDRVLFTASARDLTERKAVEANMSDFYSTVSHELRTPLTTIRGALGVMNGGLVGEIPEKAQVFVKMACDESERLVRLINDFLDIRKISAGMLQLRYASVDLAKLIEDASSNLQTLAASADISLRSRGETTAPLSCDRDRIVQVLTNLISNAIKFSPPSSTVTIALSMTEDEKHYRVEVIDQGKGIRPDQIGELFGMFKQLDTGDKRSAEGTGLGLAICKALVNQHGGTIGASSDGTSGSTFWFELPLAPSPNQLSARDCTPENLQATKPLPVAEDLSTADCHDKT